MCVPSSTWADKLGRDRKSKSAIRKPSKPGRLNKAGGSPSLFTAAIVHQPHVHGPSPSRARRPVSDATRGPAASKRSLSHGAVPRSRRRAKAWEGLGWLPERETEGTESLRKAIGERQALKLKVRVFPDLDSCLPKAEKRDDHCDQWHVCVAESTENAAQAPASAESIPPTHPCSMKPPLIKKKLGLRLAWFGEHRRIGVFVRTSLV